MVTRTPPPSALWMSVRSAMMGGGAHRSHFGFLARSSGVIDAVHALNLSRVHVLNLRSGLSSGHGMVSRHFGMFGSGGTGHAPAHAGHAGSGGLGHTALHDGFFLSKV